MPALYVALAVGAGLLLYVLRCRAQLWYGATEIVVAIVVLYLAIEPPAQPIVSVRPEALRVI
jgi:hypothetical protein